MSLLIKKGSEIAIFQCNKLWPILHVSESSFRINVHATKVFRRVENTAILLPLPTTWIMGRENGNVGPWVEELLIKKAMCL